MNYIQEHSQSWTSGLWSIECRTFDFGKGIKENSFINENTISKETFTVITDSSTYPWLNGRYINTDSNSLVCISVLITMRNNTRP